MISKRSTMQRILPRTVVGSTVPAVPLNSDSAVLYSDSSWAMQQPLGILIGLVSPEVVKQPCQFWVIDWRSSRSQRACRSTLAARATAAGEASDRVAYINIFLSEFMCGTPAHKSGLRMDYLQDTDAKSLFDSIISENPSLLEKSASVNIRAMQETITASQMRWVPT